MIVAGPVDLSADLQATAGAPAPAEPSPGTEGEPGLALAWNSMLAEVAMIDPQAVVVEEPTAGPAAAGSDGHLGAKSSAVTAGLPLPVPAWLLAATTGNPPDVAEAQASPGTSHRTVRIPSGETVPTEARDLPLLKPEQIEPAAAEPPRLPAEPAADRRDSPASRLAFAVRVRLVKPPAAAAALQAWQPVMAQSAPAASPPLVVHQVLAAGPARLTGPETASASAAGAPPASAAVPPASEQQSAPGPVPKLSRDSGRQQTEASPANASPPQPGTPVAGVSRAAVSECTSGDGEPEQPLSRSAAGKAAPPEAASRGAMPISDGSQAPAVPAPGPSGAAPATSGAGRPANSPAEATAALPEPPENAEKAARPETSARRIDLRVGGRAAEGVDVQVVERSGRLHVAVRTPDNQLAASLRENLSGLVARVERGGFTAETWTPADAPTSAMASARQTATDAHRGFDDSGSGADARGDQQPDQHPGRRRQDRPEWIDELGRDSDAGPIAEQEDFAWTQLLRR